MHSAQIYGVGKYVPLVGSYTYAIANGPRLWVTSMHTSHTIKRSCNVSKYENRNYARRAW